MVARGRDGRTAAFPVTETVHQNSICWVTETPAAVAPAASAAAAELAQQAVQSLPGARPPPPPPQHTHTHTHARACTHNRSSTESAAADPTNHRAERCESFETGRLMNICLWAAASSRLL